MPLFVQSLKAGGEGEWEPLVGLGTNGIEAMLRVLAPPDQAMLLRFGPEAAARVPPALVASGYAEHAQEGVTALMWARTYTDPSARDPTGPFGNGLGAASRVALPGNLLL